MDHNTKNPNTADALLQMLKQNMAQNDSDKESIAAEEAAARQSLGKRYKFRVMKRDEYLEKKRIADALAAAADDADISDDELEALLRNYLKNTPQVNPVVEEVPAEAPAGTPIIDLDKPLSREETPFFEDTPIELIDAAADSEPAGDNASADLLDTLAEDDLDLDALLSLIDETAEPAAQPAAAEPAVTAQPADEALTLDDDFTAVLSALNVSDAAPAEDPPAEPADSTAAGTDTVTDDELAALLAAFDSETADTGTAEPVSAEPVISAAADAPGDGEAAVQDVVLDDDTDTLDALIDDDFAALLASIPEDGDDGDIPEQTDVSADFLSDEPLPTDTVGTVTDAELEAMLAMMEGDTVPTASDAEPAAADAVTDAELEAMLAVIEKNDIPEAAADDPLAALAADTDGIPAEEPGDAAVLPAEEAASDIADTASSADSEADAQNTGDGEFDQTDLDLMIAFGMEDQLEHAVGKERAKKYKKAIGDRSDNHYNEMHAGDRPDTVQDKHAEYVSAAQNRDIFAEYKKKYSGMLFRFLGALFFLILLFFFENDRLLGITMPSIFDREQYPLVYTLFDLQLVVLSGAMVWRGIRTGIRAIFRGRPVPESITGFLFLACIVYTAVIAALCPMHGLQLYNFPIGLAVLFELCYEFMNLRREIMSFKIVSSKKLKYAVDAIAPKDGEAERKMFAEYISDDPALFRIKRTAFVESFFARTETYPRTQRILRTVLPAVLLMVLAFFAAKFILSGSVYEALTVSYITMLLTLPSCAFIAFSYPMYRASGFAYAKDSAMIGEASLGEYADASVVSFDDKEVFPARGVRVRNVKVYGENRIDHVIYAAASVFHVVGGPLADVFETATGELGYAENVKLTRLDRDGIEARVDGGTVLIGRAAFINRYGYSVSLNESEKSMEETGDASILYIAYDNNVSAKLYIQYSVEPDFEVVLKQLYRQGVCVGIKTSDPNIDDHLLSCKIKMSKYPVKIIKCAEPKETAIIVDRLSSGIVSKSSAKALLQTLAICDRVLSASRTNNVLSVVSILLGMAAMAFCVISGMAVTLAPVWIALYQLFWIIPVIAISRYYI